MITDDRECPMSVYTAITAFGSLTIQRQIIVIPGKLCKGILHNFEIRPGCYNGSHVLENSRIRQDVLKDRRAEYGDEIVAALGMCRKEPVKSKEKVEQLLTP